MHCQGDGFKFLPKKAVFFSSIQKVCEINKIIIFIIKKQFHVEIKNSFLRDLPGT